ncbi:MAG: uroporphyrinogen-III C-methyltransferase [Acidimicrobiia bacterium]|nr:uroporphyrinogen-III C-methyltransferase [Acidimicrobiia bacterium]
MSAAPHLLPLFLKLQGRRVLVVGAGPVAASKAAALLAAGADVTVVAPEVCAGMDALPVSIVRRSFEPGDVEDAWLVVAAAPTDVNREVAAAGAERLVFVNAVDDPEHASAYAAGVVTRGAATVAVSTSGLAPALAGLLREALEEVLPADLGAWVEDAARQREAWKRDGVPLAERRRLLLDRLVARYGRRHQGIGPPGGAEAGSRPPPVPSGFVSIVGAGPGDPDLWTVRAARRIAEADVLYYDALVDGEVLAERTAARCFCVGKRAGGRGVCQETIHDVLVRTARRGKRVVRLKGGDPFVFGRGAEEAIALAAAGIPFEIVPGISSALAGPALAGIPVTHRGVASGMLIVSGHHPGVLRDVLRGVRPGRLTVVVLMGLAHRGAVVAALREQGWEPSTPAAVVLDAGRPSQQRWVGALEALPSAPVDGRPGVIVIGDVVGVGEMVTRLASGQGIAGEEVRYGGQ